MTTKTFNLEEYELQELTEAFHVFDVTKRGLIPFEQAKILGTRQILCFQHYYGQLLVQTYGFSVSRHDFTDFDGSSHSNLISLNAYLNYSMYFSWSGFNFIHNFSSVEEIIW